MKLWLLRPKENLPLNENPWSPWYDKCFGFVVRAETEQEARDLASNEIGEEGIKAWKSNKFSTCEELTAEGKAGVVIYDFANA